MVLSRTFHPASCRRSSRRSCRPRRRCQPVTEPSRASGQGKPAAGRIPIGRPTAASRGTPIEHLPPLTHPPTVPEEGLLPPCPGPRGRWGLTACSLLGNFSWGSAWVFQLPSLTAAGASLENAPSRGTQDSGRDREGLPCWEGRDLRLLDLGRGPGEVMSTHRAERGALERSADPNLNPPPRGRGAVILMTHHLGSRRLSG